MKTPTIPAALMPRRGVDMRRQMALVGAGAAMVLLASCTAAVVPQQVVSTPTPSKPPAEGFTYQTLAELRDTATAAGYECDWVQEDEVDLAAESGTCSGSDVFMLFSTESSRDGQVETYRRLAEMLGTGSVDLVGPNWIIHHEDAAVLEMIQGATGGIIQKIKGSDD